MSERNGMLVSVGGVDKVFRRGSEEIHVLNGLDLEVARRATGVRAQRWHTGCGANRGWRNGLRAVRHRQGRGRASPG